MQLVIDKQTLDDLNIFGRGDNSVSGIFNRTRTQGGVRILEEMFNYPLADINAINKRRLIISHFKNTKTVFPFRPELLDSAEQYLANNDERTKLSLTEDTLGRKFNSLIGADVKYQQIIVGISSVIEILIRFRSFIEQLRSHGPSTPMEDIMEAGVLIDDPEFTPVFNERLPVKLDYTHAVAFDKLLRYEQREKIKKIFHHIYCLDVYIAVGQVAEERQFVFANALSSEKHTIKIEGLYHPKLENAVANNIQFVPGNNILFLTGANMAGKSTLMKSVGIAVFLAHMGFPVPAKYMEFSVCDGLLTTINLSDNLNAGFSHFYSEVLRVKKMALQLRRSANLFIIFDELFRGTNVRDAYEATVAITAAFAKKANCMFLVSTHIMEAGETLKGICNNINFVYLPTKMEGDKPFYTRLLEPGITADRHGMKIVENEGILDILKNGRNSI